MWRWGGKVRPIAFASKRLTPSQRKYCTTRKELLALITFTRQFRHYLLGRRFLIRTNHSGLAWLMKFKDIEGQLARWLEELAQFDMQIVHRKGKEHANAGAFSRFPDDMPCCDCYRAGSEVASLPCGGCKYCSRAHQQRARFEDDVDDVVPLAVVLPKATSEDTPRIRKYKDHDSYWASIILPNKRGEEKDRKKEDPELKIIYGWIQEKKSTDHRRVGKLVPHSKSIVDQSFFT